MSGFVYKDAFFSNDTEKPQGWTILYSGLISAERTDGSPGDYLQWCRLQRGSRVYFARMDAARCYNKELCYFI